VREGLSLLGFTSLALLGGWFLQGLVGQGALPFLLALSPLLRGLFRGRVGVYYGGAVLGLAGAMVWRLGGPYAALAYQALALAADGFFRREEEGYGFMAAFFPALLGFYLALGV
jgi:hypothetical protein